MKEIRVETEIAAPAERVWQVLTNFAAYPNWNPFIRSVEGRAKTDAILDVRIQPSSGRGLSLKPKVLKHDSGRELRWQGQAWGLPLLMQEEHTFTVEPLGKDRCRFVQRQSVAGLLSPLFAKTVDQDWKRGLEEMNQALKERAEHSGA